MARALAQGGVVDQLTGLSSRSVIALNAITDARSRAVVVRFLRDRGRDKGAWERSDKNWFDTSAAF